MSIRGICFVIVLALLFISNVDAGGFGVQRSGFRGGNSFQRQVIIQRSRGNDFHRTLHAVNSFNRNLQRQRAIQNFHFQQLNQLRHQQRLRNSFNNHVFQQQLRLQNNFCH